MLGSSNSNRKSINLLTDYEPKIRIIITSFFDFSSTVTAWTKAKLFRIADQTSPSKRGEAGDYEPPVQWPPTPMIAKRAEEAADI